MSHSSARQQNCGRQGQKIVEDRAVNEAGNDDDDRSKPYNVIIDKGESIEFNWPPYEPQAISYALGFRHAQKLKEKYPHLQ